MIKDLYRNKWGLIDYYSVTHEALKKNADWEVSHMYNRGKGEEGCPDGMIFYGFRENANQVLDQQLEHWMIDEMKAAAVRSGVGELFEKLEVLLRRVVEEFEGIAPIEVQAVPEGHWYPTGTPFAQIRNTVEGFGELVSLFEAVLLQNAFASGCATRAFHMRQYLLKKQKEYGYDDSFLNRFHSFGWRGHTSRETGYWAGSSWATSLNGTDDFHMMLHFPNAPLTSIAATAHKVLQNWDKELDCFLHSIGTVAKTSKKVVALVIDTYNVDRVIDDYMHTIVQNAANQGVHVVFRPDSGDVMQQAVRIYKNAKRMGATNVSVIIGEGMSFKAAIEADKFFESQGVPLNFISYGIGAGFYKDIDRDYLGFAMKTAFSNGKPRMKFSAVPVKRSIPNKVVINKNVAGNYIVSFEKYVGEESIYETIYYHDGNLAASILVEPTTDDWYDTRNLILSATAHQEQILLAPEVHEMIDQLAKYYQV